MSSQPRTTARAGSRPGQPQSQAALGASSRRGQQVRRQAGRSRRDGVRGGGTVNVVAHSRGDFGWLCIGFLGLQVILGQNFRGNGPKTSCHRIVFLATDNLTLLLIYSNG